MILNRDDDENDIIYRDKYNKIPSVEEEKEHVYKKKRKNKHQNINLNFNKKLLLFRILFILFIIILFLITIIILTSSNDETKRENKEKFNNNILQNSEFIKKPNSSIQNDTYKENNNSFYEKTENNIIIDKINEDKSKNELIRIYNDEGIINVMKFYQEYICQNYNNSNSSSFNHNHIHNYNNIHITIGFTDDNIDTIIKHISSILYQSSQTTFNHIHMMNPGSISYESIIKLKNMIFNINNSSEIIVYNASNVLNDFIIRSDNFSKFLQEYAKLYAFKIIKDVKKIIFLDGDDCIVQKDLTYLYGLNMEDIYARGITENPSVFRSMSWMDKYLYDRSHYINTGVMLVNLELCQQSNIYDQARRLNNDDFYLKTEEPFQDIINILMRRKIEFFGPKYNKINFYESPMDRKDESKWYSWMVKMLENGFKNNHFYTKVELIDADENPVIIHYAWDRYLNKNISKYEEVKNYYAKLSGLIN